VAAGAKSDLEREGLDGALGEMTNVQMLAIGLGA